MNMLQNMRVAIAALVAFVALLFSNAAFSINLGGSDGGGRSLDATVVVAAASFKPETRTQTIASEAVTRQTESNGKRHSNTSGWTRFKAPDGMAINRDATMVRILNQYGSEHTYKVQYGDFVEVVPGSGIVAPTMVEVQTHARSAKGLAANRGVMKIEVDVTMTRFRAQANASAG